ncbi:MAG: peptidoglycan editing factor PgeF [Deltaproteobacteria bacterium]|nr:peptidoglycan editing factor PgeF [Deltaproteobacteria bacterium]
MLIRIRSTPVIQAPFLNDFNWLTHGFSLKDIPIERYVEAFQMSGVTIPNTKQIHSDRVVKITKKEKNIIEADAFITDQANVVCMARTADCLPILLADTKRKVVGAVHAGWRGSVQKILVKTIEKMRTEFGTELTDLRIAFGPSIGGHCYQVGEEVTRKLKENALLEGPWLTAAQPRHWYLDLSMLNAHLLAQMEIQPEQVYRSLACTACDLEKFHSYRREGGKKGEQVSFIVIR